MKIEFDVDGTCAGFKDAVRRLMRNHEIQGILALSCDKNGFTPAELDPLLAEITVPVFGGCFPGIVCQNQAYERGTLLIGLPVKPEVQVINDLSGFGTDFDDAIDTAKFDAIDDGTMVLLVDGMFRNVNSLLDSVFNAVGLAVGYLGGGAASLELVQKPSLFTNEGLTQDSAVLAHLPISSGIGIAHGMQSVGGPHKVTGSSLNTVSTIDWQPAAQFYKDVISQHPDYDPENRGILGTDPHFSLGLNRLDSERVILEPVWTGPDDSLIFMAEVREGEFVDIMRVTPESMVQSAALALDRAIDDFNKDSPPQTVLSFDCISRKLFLGDRFDEELQSIGNAGIVHVGALTCGGEIGTNGKDFLDYHNRTCVVGVFEE